MTGTETLTAFLRRKLAQQFVTRRENRQEDQKIRDWALYDAAAQDVGRALYVAETMIHLAILNGSEPLAAIAKHLNEVRDKFAIPYAKSGPKGRVALCNCGEERAENCPDECEMRATS